MSFDVPDEDIDNLEHANNIAYVRWVQTVAVAHSDHVGLDFEGYRNGGAIFVVRRHEIDYLRPVLRGDRLELRTWIDSVMAAKCKRATEIRKNDVPVARAMTTWGFVDFTSGRPTRIPQSIRDAFGWVDPPRQ